MLTPRIPTQVRALARVQSRISAEFGGRFIIVSDFYSQELTNTALAFATGCQQDALWFAALAGGAVQSSARATSACGN